MERDKAIDSIKGIGIILVVLGHLPITKTLFLSIYGVHMPLFFFISGLLFTENNNLIEFLKKKWIRILKPYLIYSLLSFILHRILYYYTNNSEITTLQTFVISIAWGTPTSELLNWNTPLWFLTCLFCLQLFFYFILKIEKKQTLFRVIVPVSLYAVGYFFTKYQINLPWSFSSALMAIPFFYLGLKYKDIKVFFKCHLPTVIISGGLYFLFVFLNNGFTNFATNSYGTIIFSLCSGISGIIFINTLCTKFNLKIVSELGKNSLFIFGFHIFSNAIVKKAFYNINMNIDFKALIMLILSIAILNCSIFILNKSNLIKKHLFIA